MEKIELKKATRKQVKLRMGLSAVSGGGKTYSALLLAHGITGDWSKIAVVDTENGSASLYSHLGEFLTIDLQAPYTPERYTESIKACEDAGMEVIIIDSITHEWDGKGGCLAIQEQLGGRYQDWAKVTPRHQAFIDSILQSKCHIITTVRRKQDYEMSKNSSGKTTVEKAGLKEITREGFEYELTLNMNIELNHLASASKDRTGLFMDKPAFIISEETGRAISEWCKSGIDVKEIEANTLKQLQDEYLAIVDGSIHVFNDADCAKFLNGYKEWNEATLLKATARVMELLKEREALLEGAELETKLKTVKN